MYALHTVGWMIGVLIRLGLDGEEGNDDGGGTVCCMRSIRRFVRKSGRAPALNEGWGGTRLHTCHTWGKFTALITPTDTPVACALLSTEGSTGVLELAL